MRAIPSLSARRDAATSIWPKIRDRRAGGAQQILDCRIGEQLARRLQPHDRIARATAQAIARRDFYASGGGGVGGQFFAQRREQGPAPPLGVTTRPDANHKPAVPTRRIFFWRQGRSNYWSKPQRPYDAVFARI